MSKPPLDQLKRDLEQFAKKIGFHLFGIAKTQLPREQTFFSTWLQRGYAAQMNYLQERQKERQNLQAYFPGAKSVLCFGMYYHLEKTPPINTPQKGLKIARYAKNRDYHTVIKKRLRKIAKWLQVQIDCDLRVCVDTSPVLERAFAHDAGLGWVGKNTCLINRHHGSYFFLGEIISNLEFETDTNDTDHCGSCQRCLDACPTEAFPEPYVLDANRCISYWTIEHRGPIPEDIKPHIGQHWFGCDICQEVCPWNHAPKPLVLDSAYQALASDQETFEKFQKTSNENFSEHFQGSPLKRAHWSGLQRNAQIVLDNLQEES